MTEYIFVKSLLSNRKYCSKISVHEEPTFTSELAFAVQQRSILKQRISDVLLKLRESGKVNSLLHKWDISPTKMQRARYAHQKISLAVFWWFFNVYWYLYWVLHDHTDI